MEPPDARNSSLATRFLEGGAVEHSYPRRGLPPRQERWESGELLSISGEGQVFLQRCTTEDRGHLLRAVKKVPLRGEDRKRHYPRALEAVVRFSHARRT